MNNLPWVPPQASDYARELDLLVAALILLTVFFSLLVAALITYFGIKYRRGTRVDRTRPVHHHTGLEIGTIGVLMFLALAVFIWATALYAKVYNPAAPKDPLEVLVIGKQWMWHMQHTNGVRENNELHVPVGRPVKLTMISQDVIHSFFVPAFRIKRDVIPGRYTSVWFTPTKPGKYHLFCAEYCGTQHSEMGGWVYVMEPTQYAQWLATGGDASTAQASGFAQPAARETAAEAGAALYQKFACDRCHAPEAPEALRGPSLAGIFGSRVRLQNGQSVTVDEAYLRESILDPNRRVTAGYQAIMPSYKGQMTEEEVLQVIAYIKELPAQSATGTTTGGANAGGGAQQAGGANGPRR